MFLFELFPLNSLLLCLSTKPIYGQKHKMYELFYVGFSIWEKKVKSTTYNVIFHVLVLRNLHVWILWYTS